MVKRVDLSPQETPPVEAPPSALQGQDVGFFSSGSTLLDLVLGGGWACGRLVNIVGDRSTGKTLLAIEAAAGFHKMFPKGVIRYLEAESAFSPTYAAHIGLAQDSYALVQNVDAIEDVYDDIEKTLKDAKGHPILYIIDSLDAVSTEAEFSRNIHKELLVAAKARIMSVVFRKIIRSLAGHNCTLCVVSQVRDMIGAQFGGKQKACGNAINFYLSQEMWLLETGKIERTVKGLKRAIGIEIRARNKKNKVATPYREAELRILFDYGIDDELSNLNFLHTAGITAVEGVELKDLESHVKKLRQARELGELRSLSRMISAETKRVWVECEVALQPTVRKTEMDDG